MTCETITPNRLFFVEKKSWASIQKSPSTVSILSKSPDVVAEVLQVRKCFPIGLSLIRFVFHEQPVIKCWRSLQRFSVLDHFFHNCGDVQKLDYNFVAASMPLKSREIKLLFKNLLVGHFWFTFFLFRSSFFWECVLYKFIYKIVQLWVIFGRFLVFLCFGSAKRQ